MREKSNELQKMLYLLAQSIIMLTLISCAMQKGNLSKQEIETVIGKGEKELHARDAEIAELKDEFARTKNDISIALQVREDEVVKLKADLTKAKEDISISKTEADKLWMQLSAEKNSNAEFVSKILEEFPVKESSLLIQKQSIIFFSIVACILIIISGITFMLLFINNKRLKSIIKSISHIRPQSPSFPNLRDSVSHLRELFTDAASNLEKFKLDIEDFGANSWKKEKELRDKYYRIVNSLFLLVDNLEDLVNNEKKSDVIEWLYKRACQILEDEGIEEISVSRGAPLNTMYHKPIETRSSDLTRGAISEVVRKGYIMKRADAGQNDIILRPVEVIVSSGTKGQ